MTSHSCDSTTDRTWMDMVPNQTHKPGAMATVWTASRSETKGPNDPDRVPRRARSRRCRETYAVPERGLSDHERAPAGHRRDDVRRQAAS
ncbi:MAG: hypothetical protein M0C28_45195 [Candidatus Moduliflexus flocculans]|nr:hypothetical protein [Candidatus Moduliflexus flocculans]